MLILQNGSRNVLFLFLLMFVPICVYPDNRPQNQHEEAENQVINQSISKQNNRRWTRKNKKTRKLSYYLYTADFIKSFIEIPTSNVLVDSSTISSTYLAGRAPVYNRHDEKVGTCSASFLCMQNADNIFTDISNYLSIENGLIVSWFTPTTLINLELDSIIHSMVTECIVKASTKIGFNPYYGKTFNMIVSSDENKIYFKLTQI